MRALPLLRRPAISALFLLLGTLCAATALQAQTLTFTGQVYTPLGPAVSGSTAAHGDPIPNILVFVQDPASPLPVFTQGVTVPTAGQAGCSVQQDLVPATVLGSALSDYSGTFTFNVAGSLTYPINVVIQAGKWRRQYSYTAAQIASFTTGTIVTLPTMAMPSSQAEGDLPHIAVVTGSADDVECIFPQIGISTSEMTDPTGRGSINFFSGNGSSGEVISTSTPTETQLVNPAASGAIPLTNYDLVIFGCQGPSGRTDSDAAAYDENVVNYANDGGRIFATHWEFSWIQNPPEWSPLATFSSSTSTNSVTTTGQLNRSYTGEPTLAAWMNYIGSLNVSPSLLEFTLTAVFYENVLAVNAPAQTWVTLPSYSNSANQFSFDTPVGAAGVPSATLNFTNNQNTYDLGDTNDSVTINVTDNSATATAPGLTLTLQIPAGITPATLVDSSGGAWVCTLTTPNATCTLPVALAAGATDGVTLTFGIPQTTTPGSVTLVGTLANGGINQSNQCGRVLYNDYHVENSIASKTLFNNGAKCSNAATLTQAQKFLEYSLYNLSNFVAPTTSDVLVIQGPSTTQITTSGVAGVTTPIYYGQIIGDTNGLNAIVSTDAPSVTDNGSLTVAVDGTVVCTLPNTGTGGSCPNAGFEGQNVGSHPVQAFYSGDAQYQPSQSPIYNVVVQADPTTTSLTTSGTPTSYGTTVTFTANVVDQYTTALGTVNFYDGATLIGTGTLTSGVATVSTSTLGVTTHTITAVYVPANTNFLPSSSGSVTQVVTLPLSATATTLTSTVNPAYQGQNITFTATVSQLAFTVAVPGGLTNPAPTGMVTFYDGTLSLGSSPLNAAGFATLATSTLAVGTHSITAVYSGDAANNASTSAVLSQVISPNIFTMAVTPTTLNLTTGQVATVALTITDNGNFSEPVALTCTGQTAETICSLAAATVPAGGGATTMTVLASPPHPCSYNVTASNRMPRPTIPLAAGASVLLFAFRRRRKVLGLIAFAAALAILPMLSGCNTSGCTDFGVTPGTYTFTVTATSATPYAETQTQAMTMTVKP
jgi:hypothetical protein